MSPVRAMRHHWRLFRHDEPGERFENHHHRMKMCSGTVVLANVVLGIALLAAGVVLLFMPGPGIPLIVFGLALLATRSHRMSCVLDRVEPRVRHKGRQVAHHWQALPGRAKLSIVLGLATLAAAAMLFMWRFVVSAYLLA